MREPGPEVTAEYSSLLFRGPRVFRLRCTSSGWTYPNPQHDEFVAQHQLHLCRWGQACTACDPEYTVNLVHVQCYKLARLLFRNLCAVDLIQLARLTRPLLSEAFLPVSKAPIPPPPARLSTYTDLCYKTDLGCLVSEIQSRLPVELQHTIFYHTRGLFRSFTKCLDMIYTYSRLNHYASDTYQSNVQYPLQPYARPRHIGLTTVSIMGETCIAMIGSGGLRPWHDELQLSAAQPTGLQVAYGTFGLVQMRVLYIDGSVSPWMGGTSSSCKRFKTCRGRLEDMRVVHDVSFFEFMTMRPNAWCFISDGYSGRDSKSSRSSFAATIGITHPQAFFGATSGNQPLAGSTPLLTFVYQNPMYWGTLTPELGYTFHWRGFVP